MRHTLEGLTTRELFGLACASLLERVGDSGAHILILLASLMLLVDGELGWGAGTPSLGRLGLVVVPVGKHETP